MSLRSRIEKNFKGILKEFSVFSITTKDGEITRINLKFSYLRVDKDKDGEISMQDWFEVLYYRADKDKDGDINAGLV